MKTIEIATVITAIVPYILLIIGIVKDEVKQSFATWFLWLILDIITLVSIINQNGNYILLAVFSVGTALVTLFLIFKRQFAWGQFETIVSMLVAVCILILFTSGPYKATIAGTAALGIAGIPQLKTAWRESDKSPWLPWLIFTVSSLLSVIGAEAWTVPDRLFSMFSVIYCFIVTLLSMRK